MKNKAIRRESMNWWTQTSLSTFEPLLSFANIDLRQENWRDAVWYAMGREKLVVMIHITSEGTVRRRDWACNIGDEQSTSDRDIQPEIPKIFGRDPTFELAKELQTKVRKILDLLLDTTDKIMSELCVCPPPPTPTLIDRKTGLPIEWSSLESQECSLPNDDNVIPAPWTHSHWKAYHAVHELIESEFLQPDTREGIIHWTGFIHFKGEGEDAGRTLGWMLIGLAVVTFDREKAFVKKCLSCEKYFLHHTFRLKKFCLERCRSDYHNNH